MKKEKKAEKKEQPEKEIPIKTDETVEKLLTEARAEKPTEIEEPTKRKRGRPKKKVKPEADASLKSYAGNPIALTLNGFLVHFGNSLLKVSKKGAPLTDQEKLTEKDCQIGEALCYTIEYYGIEIAHPIMVLIICFGAFGWTLFSKTKTIKENVQKKVESP